MKLRPFPFTLSFKLTLLLASLLMVLPLFSAEAAQLRKITRTLLPAVDPQQSTLLRSLDDVVLQAAPSANTPLLTKKRASLPQVAQCFHGACENIKQGNFAEAKEALKGILQRPDVRLSDIARSEVHTALAETMIATARTADDLAEVVKRLQRATKRNSKNHRAHFYLGQVYDDLRVNNTEITISGRRYIDIDDYRDPALAHYKEAVKHMRKDSPEEQVLRYHLNLGLAASWEGQIMQPQVPIKSLRKVYETLSKQEELNSDRMKLVILRLAKSHASNRDINSKARPLLRELVDNLTFEDWTKKELYDALRIAL